MRSDSLPHSSAPRASTDDRSTSARIRDVAIGCFADRGVAATSVRTIAAAAGVSPALVMHHYGSKARLREACDDHVARVIRDNKHAAMAAGPGLDPLAALRDGDRFAPLLRYLARTLVDGTPQVRALVDEMVDDAVTYMQEGVDSGVLQPTDHPRGRAAVLVTWMLGALVLHDHVERLLGVDLTGDPRDVYAVPGYVGPIIELFSHGVLSDEAAARMATALPGTTDQDTGGHP